MPQDTDRLSVLVVDDEPAMRQTLEDLLELNGYLAKSAGTGQEALALAATSPFGVAIVDLRLPDLDGLDVAGGLRERDRRAQVIILTGNASVETAIRAVRDQGCDYLVKPVEPDELLRTVGAAGDRWLRHAAEEHLRRSESMLQALFEASPLPLMVLDGDLTVRLWNRSAERVFGWPANEVLGGPPPTVDERGRAESGRLLKTVLEGTTLSGVEVKRRTRAGGMLDMRLNAASVRGADGTPSAILVVLEDVTEQIKMEAHLRHAQRLDAVGRLAGGIAHDFNNLLAVIRNEADLVLGDADLGEEARRNVTTVRETADRGAALTRQLLAFARRQPMESAVVDANDVVSGLKRMMRRLLPAAVELEVELAEDVGRVNVDRGQLEQVLTNLVVNARDAVDGSGSITISTYRRDVPPGASWDGLDEGEWVVISVADTGTGIPRALRSRIFEPFFTTKGPDAGTGLGLATSYGIVKRMGGHIWLETQEGEGTTFHVCLPRASAPATVEGEGDKPAAPTGTETILLVEDEPRLRDVTRRILIRQGYTVVSVSDGDQAMEALDELAPPPDLLLTDAHLPTGDGRDLIRIARERYPELRVLLTSGSFELAQRDDVEVPFVEKPYTLAALARAVREALDD